MLMDLSRHVVKRDMSSLQHTNLHEKDDNLQEKYNYFSFHNISYTDVDCASWLSCCYRELSSLQHTNLQEKHDIIYIYIR